jgi:hypothetical protein
LYSPVRKEEKEIALIMIEFNLIHFFIIYVLARQLQGHLQRKHMNVRNIHKYNQQKKSHAKEKIKPTLRNNSVNNIMPVKEKFVI